MLRMLLGFVAAEVLIGAAALTFVLAVSDRYLGEGRSVLTDHGERVLGPAMRRVAPVVLRLMVSSRPHRRAAWTLAVRIGRLVRDVSYEVADRLTEAVHARNAGARGAVVPLRPQVQVVRRMPGGNVVGSATGRSRAPRPRVRQSAAASRDGGNGASAPAGSRGPGRVRSRVSRRIRRRAGLSTSGA